MSDKLLTLQELSLYLGVKEEKLVKLIKSGVISGYNLGGEFLRFRRDQIDAIRPEINKKITEADRITLSDRKKSRQFKESSQGDKDTIIDRFMDLVYFNDFYVISAVLIIILLGIIFNG